MKRFTAPLAAAGGALAAFLFDPVSGRRRRAEIVMRVPAFFRHRGREVARVGRRVSADAYGYKQRVAHLRPQEKTGALNDPALARKVETEIFRDPDVPKGDINIQAYDGVVELRGEVPRPELIDELVERTRSIPEVRDVENLLHLPGTPAPTHQ
jgi:osmotically-inducible protein OsmY